MSEITPMMRQYQTIKKQYEDCILFFRLGDFYEMFKEDAKLAAKELDLTLTTRDRSKENEEDRTPMCGVPYHSCEAYIARLISKGYKVAICEQTEDPALAKGLVSREVIRVVTPGTVVDPSMLEENRNNYICSVYLEDSAGAACFADVSTGEVFLTSFRGEKTVSHLINELCRFCPSEAVLSENAAQNDALDETFSQRLSCRLETGVPQRFQPEKAKALVREQFGEAGIRSIPDGEDTAAVAAGGLVSYLKETQKTDLSHMNALQYYTGGRFMELDYNARRNLELTETLRAKEKKGSLLWVLDKTKTPMGGRLIRSWLEQPLLDPRAIGRRQNAVAELFENTIAREELGLCLSEIPDLERLAGKVVYGSANCRDLKALAGGFASVPALQSHLEPFRSAALKDIREKLDDLGDLRDLIDRAVADDPPFSVREGGFIRAGYHPEVDRLRGIITGTKDLLAAVEAGEREKTGIKTLKVGYNKVFGYYIEVSKSYYDLVPDTFIRKQTLSNCERFITPELKELEHEILSARDKITALEYELYVELRDRTAKEVGRIQRTAAAAARLDVFVSFAAVAVRNNYCMPKVDLSDRIEIAEGRHPVVEQMRTDTLFVPNDTRMDCGENLLSIITGPNMAGKSTYMRQVALIVLMAQTGSFVPAKSARLGIVDRIFTRIGAADDLAAGHSTFMVEMTEVSDILKNATSKSLLILDEIGRGTSTYDGMSIARAVLEYCADKHTLGAKTLFATHYHELTVLEGALVGVKNYNIAAKKRKGDIIFLRKIVRGGADRSYGVEVAKLAGLPSRVVARAREILKSHEEGASVCAFAPETEKEEQDGQVSLGDFKAEEAAARIRKLEMDTLTPIEALNVLYELKRRLEG
ncbi:MAG: DNA mismatch repair protein MutS [Oscillospiraceae bacterium]|nr:DNA mismatch repair protein MutS [Oscillospiraceae bacterium]